MPPAMPFRLLVLALSAASLTGCATAVATAGSAVSIGVSAVGVVASTAVSATGAVVRTVTP